MFFWLFRFDKVRYLVSSGFYLSSIVIDCCKKIQVVLKGFRHFYIVSGSFQLIFSLFMEV